jgi:ketosteroid isomerase-like protein
MTVGGHRLELAGYHTLEETAPLAEKAMAKFPDGMTFEILTVTAEDNRVLVEATSDARMDNGNPYRNQYVFSFYFDEEGRITEFREFWDTLYAFETMFDGCTER